MLSGIETNSDAESECDSKPVQTRSKKGSAMSGALALVVLGVFIALLFDYSNGMQDAANMLATVIGFLFHIPRTNHWRDRSCQYDWQLC